MRTTALPGPVIGREVTPFGRGFRIVMALVALVHVAARFGGRDGGEIAVALGSAAAVAALFTALARVLRPWLDGTRGDALAGWPGGALFVVPLLAYPMGLVPETVGLGIALYVEGSLLLAGITGYGGVESAALPALVWGFRPRLYGPVNLVDLAERAPLRARGLTPVVRGLVLAALAWYWAVPTLADVRGGVGEFFAPAGNLGPVAALAIAAAGLAVALLGSGPGGPRARFLPALALLLLGGAGAVGALPDGLWAAVILGGLVAGAAALRRSLRRDSRTVRALSAEVHS
ncbi:DUF6410 domain-containing protein [Streptomyces sp. NPDC006367]|uniref:DUF6410 domain-containing protein n=1 Tax=unclassified Streptomyces TaxID=2593676 RepID=UPI0033B91717